ncbi:MAG TPA: hypothetical protein VFM35_01565, partial [Candidatus Binatia bacterium]|nr:hypothetical protein [Candidatus Binatia bacterium]
LDHWRVPVRTAFWLYLGNLGEWKLVLAMPHADKNEINQTYEVIAKALATNDIRGLSLRQIEIRSPSDEIVTTISNAIHLKHSQAPVHLSNSGIGNVFIGDAYIFRST